MSSSQCRQSRSSGNPDDIVNRSAPIWEINDAVCPHLIIGTLTANRGKGDILKVLYCDQIIIDRLDTKQAKADDPRFVKLRSFPRSFKGKHGIRPIINVGSKIRAGLILKDGTINAMRLQHPA
jgi:hypothetical protein